MSVKNDMVKYEPLVYDLDLEENIGIYFEEDFKCVEALELRTLDYARIRRMPVGFLAYTSRFSKRPYKERWVSMTSLRSSRLNPLRIWANSLTDKRAHKLSPAGVHEEFTKFSTFILFCDENGHVDVLDSPESFHRALIIYSHELNEKVEEKGRGNTENRLLTVALSVAYEIFPDADYNFRLGVKFPGYSKDEQENTRVPDEEKLFPIYRVADAVFKAILAFLKDPEKSPRVVEHYGERYWFLPAYYPLISETAMVENQQKKSRGLILTVIRDHALKLAEHSDGKLTISDAVSVVVSRLVSGDELVNENCTKRTKYVSLPKAFSPVDLARLAILAHDCFLFIFILNTSANVSVAANVLWDEAHKVEAEVQRLRSIKRRASNKSVDIVFGVRFLKRLREYFELRDFLPGADNFKNLFGTFDEKKAPLQVGDNPAGDLAHTLKRVVRKSLQGVGYRELRAFHHNSKSKDFGLPVAADSAQHSERTAIQSYTSGNYGEALMESVMFFSGLGKAVEKYEDTHAGGCTGNLISAIQVSDISSVVPDCKNLIGCLFCKHYLLHFDLVDAQKLISIDYLIEQLRSVQYNAEEFQEAYGPTQARVRWLLSVLSNASEELKVQVPKMRDYVFRNEALTEYWQSKLNILVEIGVL
jgi:hypothetical protein